MKDIPPILIWVVLGLALAASFALDFANVRHGGSIDLRNRITGERLLMHNIDAYHYKWDDTKPAEFCDPFNNPRIPVSKTTATPAMLLLHLPLALISYDTGRELWLVAQWLLLLGTAALWICRCETEPQRWLVAAVATGFTYTSAWRLHADRGQVYVLLLFLFAAWLVMTLDEKWSESFLPGLLAGLLIALRPPFLLLAPFLALHRRGQLIGAAVGLLLAVALPMFWETNCWPDYFSAMQTQSSLYRNQSEPPPGANFYPPEIEHLPTLTLAKFAVIPFADSSLYALLHRLGLHSLPELPILLIPVIPFGVWLWFSRGLRMEALLPGLVAWFFLVDLFLPALRGSYNDVMILNLIALVLVVSGRIPWSTWPCLVALPIGWAIYLFVPEQASLINLPTLFFTVGAMATLFLFTKEAIPSKV